MRDRKPPDPTNIGHVPPEALKTGKPTKAHEAHKQHHGDTVTDCRTQDGQDLFRVHSSDPTKVMDFSQARAATRKLAKGDE